MAGSSPARSSPAAPAASSHWAGRPRADRLRGVPFPCRAEVCRSRRADPQSRLGMRRRLLRPRPPVLVPSECRSPQNGARRDRHGRDTLDRSSEAGRRPPPGSGSRRSRRCPGSTREPARGRPAPAVPLEATVGVYLRASVTAVITDGTAVEAFCDFALDQWPVAGKTKTAEMLAGNDTLLVHLVCAGHPRSRPDLRWAIRPLRPDAMPRDLAAELTDDETEWLDADAGWRRRPSTRHARRKRDRGRRANTCAPQPRLGASSAPARWSGGPRRGPRDARAAIGPPATTRIAEPRSFHRRPDGVAVIPLALLGPGVGRSPACPARRRSVAPADPRHLRRAAPQ